MAPTFRRLAIMMFASLLLCGSSSAQSRRTMATWHPWQLDSVLVVWALMQGDTPPQGVESVPRGTAIEPDRAIDTPDSPYRRTGQRTAFDEAVRLTHLQHPCVARLRDAVRVVELAPWRKPEFPAVEAFEARVLRAIPAQPRAGGLEPALAEVDAYCKGTP